MYLLIWYHLCFDYILSFFKRNEIVFFIIPVFLKIVSIIQFIINVSSNGRVNRGFHLSFSNSLFLFHLIEVDTLRKQIVVHHCLITWHLAHIFAWQLVLFYTAELHNLIPLPDVTQLFYRHRGLMCHYSVRRQGYKYWISKWAVHFSHAHIQVWVEVIEAVYW